jgi:hypothetical protein
VTVGSILPIEPNNAMLGEALSEQYNRIAEGNGWEYTPGASYLETRPKSNCTISGFLEDSYGKYPNVDIDATIIMEYNTYL